MRHGHILVDGKKTTIPSYRVAPEQEITVREKSRKNDFIRASVETARGRGIPEWLDLDAENFTGKVSRLPTREDIKIPIKSSSSSSSTAADPLRFFASPVFSTRIATN